MDIQTGFFYLFAAVLLFSAFRVVTARNPVHAVLYLMLTISQASGLWMMLAAEFLAITLVLVYVGAVMVLFLFVVMMLDIDMAKLRAGIWGHLPFAITIGVVIAAEMAAVLINGFINQPAIAAGNIGDTKELGKLIYTNYLYAFEVAALILLAALVAAVALTLRRRKDTKYFDPGLAVKVQRNDRVRIVSMPAESSRANGNGSGETAGEQA